MSRIVSLKFYLKTSTASQTVPARVPYTWYHADVLCAADLNLRATDTDLMWPADITMTIRYMQPTPKTDKAATDILTRHCDRYFESGKRMAHEVNKVEFYLTKIVQRVISKGDTNGGGTRI